MSAYCPPILSAPWPKVWAGTVWVSWPHIWPVSSNHLWYFVIWNKYVVPCLRIESRSTHLMSSTCSVSTSQSSTGLCRSVGQSHSPLSPCQAILAANIPPGISQWSPTPAALSRVALPHRIAEPLHNRNLKLGNYLSTTDPSFPPSIHCLQSSLKPCFGGKAPSKVCPGHPQSLDLPLSQHLASFHLLRGCRAGSQVLNQEHWQVYLCRARPDPGPHWIGPHGFWEASTCLNSPPHFPLSNQPPNGFWKQSLLSLLSEQSLDTGNSLSGT